MAGDDTARTQSLGRQPPAEKRWDTQRGSPKKIKRDIREIFKSAGVPEKKQSCPGPEHCGMAQAGADPCVGCKVRAHLDSQPGYQAGYYAIFLASYLEAFRLSPREVSWLEFEIYQLYLAARVEHEKEEAKKLKM